MPTTWNSKSNTEGSNNYGSACRCCGQLFERRTEAEALSAAGMCESNDRSGTDAYDHLEL